MERQWLRLWLHHPQLTIMFYSEQLQSPIDAYNVKRVYGVNPENDPVKAKEIGVYPVIDCPEGYSPTHYVKEGNAYKAIASPVSNAEMAVVRRTREAKAVVDQPQTTDLVENPPKKNGRKLPSLKDGRSFAFPGFRRLGEVGAAMRASRLISP